MTNQGIPPEHFVGRDLAIVHEKLLQRDEGLNLVAIVGLPGVGKSELAVQYAQQHRHVYRAGVLKFDAATFALDLRNWMQLNYLEDYQEARQF